MCNRNCLRGRLRIAMAKYCIISVVWPLRYLTISRKPISFRRKIRRCNNSSKETCSRPVKFTTIARDFNCSRFRLLPNTIILRRITLTHMLQRILLKNGQLIYKWTIQSTRKSMTKIPRSSHQRSGPNTNWETRRCKILWLRLEIVIKRLLRILILCWRIIGMCRPWILPGRYMTSWRHLP